MSDILSLAKLPLNELSANFSSNLDQVLKPHDKYVLYHVLGGIAHSTQVINISIPPQHKIVNSLNPDSPQYNSG